jgi:hypothetical protein
MTYLVGTVTGLLLGWHAHDVVASPSESPVAPRIGVDARNVVAAIDLNDEPDLGGKQVDDEAPQERHLSSERHAEPPGADSLKEQRLGSGRSVPHRVGTFGEDGVATRIGWTR